MSHPKGYISRKLFRKPYLPIACILILGVTLSFFLYSIAASWRQTNLQIEFESRAHGYSNAVRNALDEYLGISEFFKDYFNSKERVSRDKFSRLATSALSRYLGVQALSWNPFVEGHEREKYVRDARADGIGDFMFTERSSTGDVVRAARREAYTVVYYIEPLENNRPALGYDIASNSVRRQAIDLAFDTGKPVATARIALVQEVGSQFGTLILNPVYKDGVRPATVEARRKNKRGLAVEVLRIGDAIDSGLRRFTQDDILFYLYDVTSDDQDALLYSSQTAMPGVSAEPINVDTHAKGLHSTTTFDFAERQWSLVLLPTDLFLTSQKSWSSWIVLSVGLCVTGLLVVYLFNRLKYIDEIEIRIHRETIAKKQCADSEMLYRATIENISDTVLITDDHGGFAYISPTIELIFGATPDEVAAMGNIRDLFGGPVCDLNELKSKRELFNIESTIMDRQGREHFILVNIKRVAIKNGTILYACRDITERKDAEDRLKESEARFKRLFEFAPLPYQSLDENGNVLEVNQVWLDALGYQKRDVVGKNFGFFLNPDYKDHFIDNFPKFKSIGEILGIEFEMQREDGTFIPVRFDGKIGTDQDGNFLQTHCVFKDISKEVKLEKQIDEQQKALRQSQKLDSIGHLAGGIAHDFNNILSSIIGFTELALDDVDKGTPVEDSLQEVYIAAIRAKDLVRQILAFARQSGEEVKPIRVASVAEETLKMIRSTIPSSIEVRKSIKSQSMIMGNATQTNQIFLNLCTNAAQAMEDKVGVLEVCIGDVAINRSNLKSQSGLKAGDYIEIKVSDTGVGITPEVIESIFDPYFSTKDPGEGTGMGLAVVHGIVESYHGKISVTSKKGEGAQFTVYLPITKMRDDYRNYEEEVLAKGSERILVVDDEEPIANLVCKILERLGYHVTTKTSSMEALDLFRSKPDSFDLCFTDMTMPHMTGDRLALEMMKIRSDIPVIVCSGYSKRMSEELASDLGIKAFAYKPVIRAELARTVRDVLDAAQGANRL